MEYGILQNIIVDRKKDKKEESQRLSVQMFLRQAEIERLKNVRSIKYTRKLLKLLSSRMEQIGIRWIRIRWIRIRRQLIFDMKYIIKYITKQIYKMGFSKFVEIGRVGQINRGVNENQLVVILDVLNLNRVLVEGVENDVSRQIVPISHLTLTEQKIGVLRGLKSSLLKKQIKKENVVATFNQTKRAIKQKK